MLRLINRQSVGVVLKRHSSRCSSFVANSHCSFCGTRFDSGHSLPKTCSHCQQVTYSNPLPVVVGIIYKEERDKLSVLCIRRGIEPCKGEMALIGGFLESGETWQKGLSREIEEEIGITIPDDEWRLQDARSVLQPPRLILCAVAKCPEGVDIKSCNHDPSEVEEILWVDKPISLCFETHSDALSFFYKEMEQKE